MKKIPNEEYIKIAWIQKKRFRYCPVCGVGQERTQMQPTPFCPVCGARLTDQTPERWKMRNCCWIGDEDNGTDTQE